MAQPIGPWGAVVSGDLALSGRHKKPDICVRLLRRTRAVDQHFLAEGFGMPECRKWFDERYAVLLAEALVLYPEDVLPMAEQSPELEVFADFFFADESRAKRIVAEIYATEELELAV